MAHRPTTDKFSDSQEAVFRRQCRQAVRSGPFTKGERDVILAMLNHWFHHRNGPDGGLIHPGRSKLAKRAGVSVRTVASTLVKMRDAGLLQTVSNARGGWGKATRYRVDIIALFPLCGHDYPAWVPGLLLEQNCTHPSAKIAHNMRAEIAHGNKYLSKPSPTNDVCGHLRLIIGGAA